MIFLWCHLPVYQFIFKFSPIEKIKEHKKKYYEANKEIIKEKKTKKYDCECGGKYTYNHKQRHFKSIKHIAWFMEQVD